MSNSTLDEVVVAIRNDSIGGAADMAREAARAITAVAVEAEATGEDAGFAVDGAVDALLAVTPSIAPVLNVLHAAVDSVEEASAAGDAARAVIDSMTRFRERLDQALEAISSIGAEMIRDGDRIFTYSISSTVWGIFRQARAQGKHFDVVATESRPANEGLWNITELGKDDIPVTMGIDAAMGTLMRGCSMFVVGSDGIASNGACLCKIGTFPAATVARELGIPTHVAADTSKFDPLTLLGFPFKIREMPHRDIVTEPTPNLTVRNPIFDVTPAHLVAAIITERGILHPAAASTVLGAMRQSERLTEKLQIWVAQRDNTGVLTAVATHAGGSE
ncbi:MAG: translation initiation factor eIF-2B [Chloroflexota bacterium]|nr:MAG: hypothetical protein DLM70_16895 [Chloroflexota bacterium]